MRLSMNKEDICKPIEIPAEKRSEFLSTIIKSCISCSDIIGENLTKECINYFEQLEKNITDAIKIIESPIFIDPNNIDIDYLIARYNKDLKEIKAILERGKNER